MTQLHKLMLEEIQRRNYTESTTRAYDRIIKDFAFYFHRSPDQLGPEHVREGFVAKFLVKGFSAARVVSRESDLGGETEQFGDEVNLAGRIPFCQPPHSTFPNHVHCFDSLQRPPRAPKRTITFGQPNPFLYCPVVLLDQVIEILALA